MPQNGTQKQDTTEDWQSAWSARLGARGRVIKYRPREHPCGYAVPFVPPLPLTRWDGCCSWGVLYEVSTYSYTEVGAEQNNDFRPSAVRAKVGAQHTSHPGENLVSHPHQKCPLKVLRNTPSAAVRTADSGSVARSPLRSSVEEPAEQGMIVSNLPKPKLPKSSIVILIELPLISEI